MYLNRHTFDSKIKTIKNKRIKKDMPTETGEAE